MRTSVPAVLLLLLPSVAVGQLTKPASWRTRTDGASSDTVYYVQMPPGWHITTGPGTLLYDPANVAAGRFGLSMEVHLFPKASDEGYGLFLGGRDLDTPAASWVGVLMRRDGAVQVVRVAGSSRTTLLDWRPGSVKPHPGTDDTVLNVLGVRVEPDSVRIEGNGQRIAALPRAELPLDGVFGFRAGPGINLHVTNLDLTTRIAPAPRPPR